MQRLRMPILTSLCLIFTSLASMAQVFNDASARRSCQGNVRCSHVVVTEPDRRARPAIQQPVATEKTMGACGNYLPSGQDYRAQLTGTSCGGNRAFERARLPMPVDQDLKDKADQLLSSSMDDLTKRTKAQDILKKPITWTETFTVPMSESWSYVAIQGDFNGPSENYQTTCAMTRKESYEVPRKVYRDECAEWVVDEPVATPTYTPSSPSMPRNNDTYTPSPRREEPRREQPQTDRLKGTSSGEIENRSRDNYERLREERRRNNNGSNYIEGVMLQTRNIAQSRRCVRYEKVYVRTEYDTHWRDLAPITGPCLAQRGTWRTYPVVQNASRRCANQQVTVKVEYKLDPQWNPTNPNYLELLPNKFDLLPGEKEQITVGLNSQPSSSHRPQLQIENAWNEYSHRILPESHACTLGAKEFTIEIDTHKRIKRKAPNPFSVPEDQKAIIGLDDKGRPKSLKLIDHARNLRLDSSMNSRRFENQSGADQNQSGESIGSSEAGGSKAFWVSTQFRMTLYKIDSWGRRFPVTLPNKFSTDRTDVFDNEMMISLGGRGGMDRLYRPSGPLQFIFGGLYHYLGVELSPETNYELEVKAAQREFPFYESTCSTGEVACGDENSKEELFSEAITIPFKTEQTTRSWLKWLKDQQFVIF